MAIEQVVQHGEVDVFNAVKTVRRHRPALVENMVRAHLFFTNYLSINSVSLLQTEYKYCYDLVLHYVLHYLNQQI